MADIETLRREIAALEKRQKEVSEIGIEIRIRRNALALATAQLYAVLFYQQGFSLYGVSPETESGEARIHLRLEKDVCRVRFFTDAGASVTLMVRPSSNFLHIEIMETEECGESSRSYAIRVFADKTEAEGFIIKT